MTDRYETGERDVTSAGGSDADLPEDFAILYDATQLALIERQRAEPRRAALDGDVDEPRFDDDVRLTSDDDGPSRGLTAGGLVRRYGVVGAMGARSMLGLAEVIEPEKAKQTVIEFAPDRLDEDEQLVTFLFVPGDPAASRLIIRPWLLRRRSS